MNTATAHASRRVLCLLIPAMLLGTVVLVLPACNTVKGVGEDITSVGKAGERAISNDDNAAEHTPADDNN